ncbi:MAG: prolyl oligopeptidase family serine peptidase [Pirellulales bacterium]
MPVSTFMRLVIVGMLIGVSATAEQVVAQTENAPGDAMIRAYLARATEQISAQYQQDLQSHESWEAQRPARYEEYLYMLGLSPLPEKTPLQPHVTGTLNRGDYFVDKLHYQSRPGLYVTANLYRPAKPAPGKKLPAVLYVCGHSNRGRNGNKVAYQSHGIWFARHGYICLMVDTLQLGEIAAFHHGTYNLQRWWWHSRGYTPAGVEAWNGIRGIDYLLSRDDVDPERIAVTGISGGGAATFWIAAADSRVRLAVPVSGMADLESYVAHDVINGHCDCMFLYNTFQWPWTRIAGLVAPRPLLFVNSDNDSIFPMDANERVINRLERLYSLYGASDHVDAVVSVGGHAYRQDIRQAVYRFMNSHLMNNSQSVTDSEVDLVSEGAQPGAYPIAPEELRVFPNDSDLPSDQRNTVIDQEFVPVAQIAAPQSGAIEPWRKSLLDELRRVTWRYFPDQIPAASVAKRGDGASERVWTLQSEPGIEYVVRSASELPEQNDRRPIVLVVLNADEASTTPDWVKPLAEGGKQIVLCEPRGIGATNWQRKNPPNYVERSHALLGRTVDTGRLWDVVAAARWLASSAAADPSTGRPQLTVAGRSAAGVLAGYSALLADEISAVHLDDPPATHMDAAAPQLLNILRVADVPDLLGAIAPRQLTLQGAPAAPFARTSAAYEAAGAKDRLTIQE